MGIGQNSQKTLPISRYQGNMTSESMVSQERQMDSPLNRKDEELAIEADSGLRGQGSVVEMMRRLKEAVLSLDRTSTKQQEKMLSLTRWIMSILAGGNPSCSRTDCASGQP
ncbi:MAG: hypothetical protein ACREU8_04095 [Gammaproteobacteria bacterium]